MIGAVAMVIVLIIILNPEFFALGLLGDSAFFDLLLFVVSFKLETILTQVFHFGFWIYSKLRWRLLVGSMGLISILLAIDAAGEKLSAAQKAIARHLRLFSIAICL